MLIFTEAFQNFNLEGSLLNFVGQVHRGVKGVVFMPDGTPAKYAEIGKVRIRYCQSTEVQFLS